MTATHTNNEDIFAPPYTRQFQECLQCGELIGAQSGSKDAICKNCGYKDPCCE